MTSAEEALKALATTALRHLDLGHLTVDSSIVGMRPKQKTCNVCAVGALAYASYVTDNPDIREMELKPTGHFLLRAVLWRKYQIDRQQVRSVDLAFHRGGGFYSAESEEDRAAVFFGRCIKGKTKRMRAIMQNIIDNNGTFQP